MWDDMFSLQLPAPEKILRTVLVYLGIAILIRVAGKRLFMQMDSLDLVVVLLLSNVVQNAIIGDDNTVAGGLLGAVVLVVLNAVLERLTTRFTALRHLLEGRSTIVVTDGIPDQRSLDRLGLSTLSLRAALRTQGADSIDEVATAQIEPGGTIVVDLEPGAQNASRDELRAAVDEIKAYLDARLAGSTP